MNTPEVMLPERTLPRRCSGAKSTRVGREGLICRHFLGQLRTNVLPVCCPKPRSICLLRQPDHGPEEGVDSRGFSRNDAASRASLPRWCDRDLPARAVREEAADEYRTCVSRTSVNMPPAEPTRSAYDASAPISSSTTASKSALLPVHSASSPTSGASPARALPISRSCRRPHQWLGLSGPLPSASR